MPKSNMMSEEEWRSLMEGTHDVVHKSRRVRGLLPAEPRCRLCYTPFRGPRRVRPPADVEGQRTVGQEPDPLPALRAPDQLVRRDGGGGPRLVPVRRRPSVERARPAARDDRVHEADAAVLRGRHPVLFEHEALLDKIVGDEVVGFFLPFMTGDRHPRGRRADRTGAVRRRRATARRRGPGSRSGAGVHTGDAFVGYVSRGEASEFTALGDTINVAAHLAGASESR